METVSSEKSSKSLNRWKLGVFGLIVLSAIVVAAMKQSDRPALLSAAEIERAHHSAEVIQRASANLAMERGLVYLALRIPMTERATWLVEIDNRRVFADQALNAATEEFMESHWTKVSWPVGRMKAQFKHLERLRMVTDGQLSAPLSDRSRDLADVWFREATAIIKNLNTVLQVVHARIAYDDPGSRFSLRVQRYAGNIAELAGRERALIAAAAAADEPLSSRKLTMIKGYRLQMVEDWRRISLVTNSSPVAVGLTGKVANAQREYARVFIKTAEKMVNERHHDGVFPLTAERWFDESSRAIDSILEVGAVAGARVGASSYRTS